MPYEHHVAYDMKRPLLIVLMFSSIYMSSSALAYDPLDCIDDIAKADEGIIMGLSAELCSGTQSSDPVQCYKDLFKVDSGMIRGIAVDLCAGSTNAKNTIACYLKASNRGMIRSLATTLCGAKKQKSNK